MSVRTVRQGVCVCVCLCTRLRYANACDCISNTYLAFCQNKNVPSLASSARNASFCRGQQCEGHSVSNRTRLLGALWLADCRLLQRTPTAPKSTRAVGTYLIVCGVCDYFARSSISCIHTSVSLTAHTRRACVCVCLCERVRGFSPVTSMNPLNVIKIRFLLCRQSGSDDSGTQLTTFTAYACVCLCMRRIYCIAEPLFFNQKPFLSMASR